MRTFIIYKTTNQINGKFYIGKHFTSADDGYLGSGLLLDKSIKKYGKENFIRETIELCTSANVDEREVYWIDKLDARNMKVGYNIAKGGKGGDTISLHPNKEQIYKNKRVFRDHSKWTKERKSKHSQILKEKQINKGLQRSQETRTMISQTRIQNKTAKGINNPMYGIRRYGKDSPHYGKQHTQDTKDKISKSKSKYQYIVVSPNGKKYVIENLKYFCEENHLNFKSFVANSHRGVYKKWKIKRVLKNC